MMSAKDTGFPNPSPLSVFVRLWLTLPTLRTFESSIRHCSMVWQTTIQLSIYIVLLKKTCTRVRYATFLVIVQRIGGFQFWLKLGNRMLCIDELKQKCGSILYRSTIAKLQICANYSKIATRRWPESSGPGSRVWRNHGWHVWWRGSVVKSN